MTQQNGPRKFCPKRPLKSYPLSDKGEYIINLFFRFFISPLFVRNFEFDIVLFEFAPQFLQ